jgi:hypothetical protein
MAQVQRERVRPERAHVASRVHQAAFNSAAPERCHCTVHAVALGDAAEVDAQRARETHAHAGDKDDIARAAFERHIEGALALSRKPAGGAQHAPCVAAHGHRLRMRLAVQAGNFACRVMRAEQRLQDLDFREGAAHGPPSRGRIVGARHDLDEGAE